MRQDRQWLLTLTSRHRRTRKSVHQRRDRGSKGKPIVALSRRRPFGRPFETTSAVGDDSQGDAAGGKIGTMVSVSMLCVLLLHVFLSFQHLTLQASQASRCL